jgi:phosphate:Na+ symporter
MAYGVFLLLGGIGLFLYGINFMSSALEKLAGNNLRHILEKMTKTGFISVLVGLGVTMLIQSSGATSVIVVSFVNAGLMKLINALYVIIGANIGTTITAQIIAFKIEKIAPLILFAGVVMFLFIKDKLVRKIGGVVLGFGMLFTGIYIMGQGVSSLNLANLIKNFLMSEPNPIFCMLFGIVFTAIIQSSSASVGILQVLLLQTVGLTVGLKSVMFLIIGMNIGAASPVVLLSLSGNTRCKQGALADVLAKFMGAAAFIILMLIVPGMPSWIMGLSEGNVARQIANLHLAFNLVSTAALFPMVPFINKICERALPVKEEDNSETQGFMYLDSSLLLTPHVAVVQCKKEILRMADLAKDNLTLALKTFFEKSVDESERVLKTEQTINYLNHEITGFLIKLYSQKLDPEEAEKVGMMMRVVTDIERIGDHAENIIEYSQEMKNGMVVFSAEGLSELKTIASKAQEVLELAIQVYDNDEFDVLQKVSDMEEQVDEMHDTFNENHITRLKSQSCNPRAGMVFGDLTSNLERCSDHAINIAYAIKGEKTSLSMKKIMVKTMGENVY